MFLLSGLNVSPEIFRCGVKNAAGLKSRLCVLVSSKILKLYGNATDCFIPDSLNMIRS